MGSALKERPALNSMKISEKVAGSEQSKTYDIKEGFCTIQAQKVLKIEKHNLLSIKQQYGITILRGKLESKKEIST